MGIAELEPRQLAPSVGTTGSGSTGSPALSSSSATARSYLINYIIDNQVRRPASSSHGDPPRRAPFSTKAKSEYEDPSGSSRRYVIYIDLENL
jgi:hypothetical protein